jgi:hypothetical protein
MEEVLVTMLDRKGFAVIMWKVVAFFGHEVRRRGDGGPAFLRARQGQWFGGKQVKPGFA